MSGLTLSRSGRSFGRSSRPPSLPCQDDGGGLADLVEQPGAGALEQLEHDVAGEAVGDDDVDGAERDVAALDVAGEEQARVVGEQPVGVDHEAVALALLVAVREQADARLVDAEHAGREGRAHVRELVQLIGPRIGRRADVEHDDRALPRRQRLHDRRAQHARQAAQLEQAGGQHGARSRRPRRRPRARPSCTRRMHVTTEASSRSRAARAGSSSCEITYGRVHDLDLGVVAHERLELGRRTAQQHAQVAARHRVARSRDDRLRAPVAAHRVERDGDRGAHASSGSISRPLYVLHVGHIRWARVGEPHCAQTTTGDRRGHALVAALVAAGFRGLLLRDRHTARKRSGRVPRAATTARAAAPSARPWAARSRTRRRCGRRRTAGRAPRSRRGSGSRSAARGSRASVAQRSTSSSSPSRYGVVSSSSTSRLVGLVLARTHVELDRARPRGSAGTGRRWRRRRRGRRAARPASRVRPSCAAHLARLGAVLLRAGRERGDGDGHLLRGGGRRERACSVRRSTCVIAGG